MPNRSRIIELHIPSRLGYERIAVSATAEAARMMQFSKDRIDDLKTAVSEACLNAIEHGRKGRRAARILVTLEVARSKLEVNVHNRGRKFKSAVPIPDMREKILGTSSPRGWGMFLIKTLVDEVEFKSVPAKGNVTRMVIYVHGRSPKL